MVTLLRSGSASQLGTPEFREHSVFQRAVSNTPTSARDGDSSFVTLDKNQTWLSSVGRSRLSCRKPAAPEITARNTAAVRTCAHGGAETGHPGRDTQSSPAISLLRAPPAPALIPHRFISWEETPSSTCSSQRWSRCGGTDRRSALGVYIPEQPEKETASRNGASQRAGGWQGRARRARSPCHADWVLGKALLAQPKVS